MTGWMFRGTWPLSQGADRTAAGFTRHKVLASAEVDDVAAEAGCRITGPITWSMTAAHLVAEAPAQPIDSTTRKAA